MMHTDTKQQIETALRAFYGSDLRAASIGLLNTLGHHSEKTLDLNNTPDAFLAEFDRRARKFRKDKALFERWKSVELLPNFDVRYSIPKPPLYFKPPLAMPDPTDMAQTTAVDRHLSNP